MNVPSSASPPAGHSTMLNSPRAGLLYGSVAAAVTCSVRSRGRLQKAGTPNAGLSLVQQTTAGVSLNLAKCAGPLSQPMNRSARRRSQWNSRKPIGLKSLDKERNRASSIIACAGGPFAILQSKSTIVPGERSRSAR